MEVTVPADIGHRLVRADENLSTLTERVRSYLLTIPYRTEFEPDPKHSDRRSIIVRIDKALPDDLQILMSDCIHHWRAALDNFAFIIGTRHHGANPNSEFPIFLDPNKFAQRTKSGLYARTSGYAKIAGLKSGAQQVVERLQPYHGRGLGDPLWMLHELSNADKHRLPNVAQSLFNDSTYEVVREDPGISIRKVRFKPTPIVDHSRIGTLYLDKTDPAATFDVKFTLDYQVAFASRADRDGHPLPTNGLPINLTMTQIRNAVWNACWKLRRYRGEKRTMRIEALDLPV